MLHVSHLSDFVSVSSETILIHLNTQYILPNYHILDLLAYDKSLLNS